jgi:hypothetical protein
MLVDWIGFPTETERLSKTTNVTFVVQFFNTALLLMLVQGNFSEQPITFWLDNGAYTDFNPAWFLAIGNIIIGTMRFNSVYPLIEAFLYWFMRLGFRCLDSGCKCCNKYNTKSTSI